MSSWPWLEHMLLVHALLRILWQQLQQATKKRKKKGKWHWWQPKSPQDCPACQEGVKLSLFRVQRSVKPWSQVKSWRGRKKTIPTQGYACPNPACDYAGIVDTEVHALVGNGKGGTERTIQHFRCFSRCIDALCTAVWFFSSAGTIANSTS